MNLPNPKDAIHKAWLYRMLGSICDSPIVSNELAFKGGTAAAMRGYLNRFSIDLDFDYLGEPTTINVFRKHLEKLFTELGLEIKDASDNVPQYFLKYPTSGRQHGVRNTLKIDITFPAPKKNIYELIRLTEIDKIINCQTIETMFSNKLVALIDRYEKNGSIAGRDVYDIHHYFISGYDYSQDIIKERRNVEHVSVFFEQLITFVENKITPTIIQQDLNSLLEYSHFSKIKKVVKSELLMFLKEE